MAAVSICPAATRSVTNALFQVYSHSGILAKASAKAEKPNWVVFVTGSVGVRAVKSVQTTGPSVRKTAMDSTTYLPTLPSVFNGERVATASMDICRPHP